jgi:hypothetical protein
MADSIAGELVTKPVFARLNVPVNPKITTFDHF